MSKYIIHESVYSAPIRSNFKRTPLGTLAFTAVLQEAERPNRNGRSYSKDILQTAINSTYVQERLRTNGLFGEAGHPTDEKMSVQTNINPNNMAFLIRKMWFEGDLLVADCETANTDTGRNMAGVIEQGLQASFSLRAQGSVDRDSSGYSRVKPGLQIITWDWVINPSHDKAFMRTMNESVSMLEGGYSLFTEGVMFEVEDDKDLIAESIAESIKEREITLENHTVSKTYKYDASDIMIAESYSAIMDSVDLSNDNVVKKVPLDEYLIADIRENMEFEHSINVDLIESVLVDFESGLFETAQIERCMNNEEAMEKELNRLVESYNTILEAVQGNEELMLMVEEDNFTQQINALTGMFTAGLEAGRNQNGERNIGPALPVYNPEVNRIQITKLGQGKNKVENLGILIGSLATWIKNVILKVIDSITRFVRRMAGLGVSDKPDISNDKLKLKFEKAKALENKKYMIDYTKDGKRIKLDNVTKEDFSDLEVLIPEIKDGVGAVYKESMLMEFPTGGGTRIPRDDGNEKPRNERNETRTQRRERERDEYNNREEDQRHRNWQYTNPRDLALRKYRYGGNVGSDDSFYDNVPRDNRSQYGPNTVKANNITVTQLDLSDDLSNIGNASEHFFSLFDNSIGANDEALFATGDLDLFLRAINNQLEQIKTYTSDALYARNGNVVNTNIISSEKMKANNIRTKVATDKLTDYYKETANHIKRALNSIYAKQAVANTSGVNMILMNSATYAHLLRLNERITSRRKRAVSLEKSLNKTRVKFEKLYKEIEHLRNTVYSYSGNSSYEMALHDRLNDLFLSIKHIMSTILLRITAISMYIREIKEVERVIQVVNRPNKADHRASGMMRLRNKLMGYK